MPPECWISDNQTNEDLSNKMRAPLRRIEDRIRALYAQAMVASDGEREHILQELLGLVHELSERLRERAANVFLRGDRFYERRSIDVKQSPSDSGNIQTRP